MKKIALSKEQIEEKKNKLLEKINQEIEDKKNGINPTQKFLLEIEEIVQKSIENNISFARLSDNIYAIYNLKISIQSLRNFAKTNLQYSTKNKQVKNENKQVSKEATTVAEMKEISSAKKVDF